MTENLTSPDQPPWHSVGRHRGALSTLGDVWAAVDPQSMLWLVALAFLDPTPLLPTPSEVGRAHCLGGRVPPLVVACPPAG